VVDDGRGEAGTAQPVLVHEKNRAVIAVHFAGGSAGSGPISVIRSAAMHVFGLACLGVPDLGIRAGIAGFRDAAESVINHAFAAGRAGSGVDGGEFIELIPGVAVKRVAGEVAAIVVSGSVLIVIVGRIIPRHPLRAAGFRHVVVLIVAEVLRPHG
jgi:hypothetical protein